MILYLNQDLLGRTTITNKMMRISWIKRIEIYLNRVSEVKVEMAFNLTRSNREESRSFTSAPRFIAQNIWKANKRETI
jgi:hypothetical protein